MLAMQEKGRLTLLSRTLFAEMCALKPRKFEVALYASTSYLKYVHIGIKFIKMTLVKCLMDTSAGPNLVCMSFFHVF